MKIGIAFGGGGLRGAAHIGVLQVLLEHNIVPEVIAGTSAGSIVGSFYASGMTIKQMINLLALLPKVRSEDLQKALEPPQVSIQAVSWLPTLPMGIVNVKYLEWLLSKLLGTKKFHQLSKPLAIVAADIYRGETVIYTSKSPKINLPRVGRFAVETDAYLHEAVAASCAIPGIFTPKTIGKRTLVDGGLVDNVPADIVKAMGADVVIGVDLSFGVYQSTPFKHVVDILLQTYDIMGQRISDFVTRQYADITLLPATGNAALYDFAKIPAMLEAGRKEAKKMLPEITKIISAKKKGHTSL